MKGASGVAARKAGWPRQSRSAKLAAVTSGEYPNLSRPPLREAVIDIRLSSPLPPDFAEKLRMKNFGAFSRIGDVKVGGFQFQVPEDKPAQAKVTSEQVLGGRFENTDQSQVVLARRDGMTFSVLKNYRDWEHIRDDGRELWRRFLDLSGPAQVGRVALRYINVIDIPQGEDFDNYLTAAPQVPNGLPQLLGNFFQRIEVPFSDQNAIAVITQTLEPPAAVVLDIDVINQDQMDAASSDVWDKLEVLRVIKNRIFFSSVTARTVESYR